MIHGLYCIRHKIGGPISHKFENQEMFSTAICKVCQFAITLCHKNKMVPINFKVDYSFLYFNRKSFPRDEVLTENILSCTEMIPFWVSWTGGRLALGYGTLPTFRTIVSYEDPKPESIDYLDFSTMYSEGQYLFHNIPGEDKSSRWCHVFQNIKIYFWNVVICTHHHFELNIDIFPHPEHFLSFFKACKLLWHFEKLQRVLLNNRDWCVFQ